MVSLPLVKSSKANSTESLQELLTSDSEGSYMGVGSPRDIQSPIFHDRAEVNILNLMKQTCILAAVSASLKKSANKYLTCVYCDSLGFTWIDGYDITDHKKNCLFIICRMKRLSVRG